MAPRARLHVFHGAQGRFMRLLGRSRHRVLGHPTKVIVLMSIDECVVNAHARLTAHENERFRTQVTEQYRQVSAEKS
jgi:hypothetical protein